MSYLACLSEAPGGLTGHCTKRRYVIKTCILCDTKIQSSYKLCRACYAAYRAYVDTPWFKELAKLQAVQDRISQIENADIETPTALHVSAQPDIEIKKDIGRPRTDWQIVNKVLEIYDNDRELVLNGERARPLSLRAIAKEINYVVGYFTVRSILIRFRPDYNKHNMP